MQEVWIPAIGDRVRKGNRTAIIRSLFSDNKNAATIYVTDPTGSYHTRTINIFEWELDNQCIPAVILNLTPQEEITKPERYNKKGKLECWDVILDQEMNFLEGNILKYLWRHREKNGVEDLKKARVYLNKLISQEEKK